MNKKYKSKFIPDFEDENRVLKHSDSKKGEALFELFLRQTDQNNKALRSAFLGSIREYFDIDPRIATLSPIAKSLESHIKASDNLAPGPVSVEYSHLKNLSENDTHDLAGVLQIRTA